MTDRCAHLNRDIKILFICKGSVHDGIGHITRTKAVASQAGKQATVKMLIIGERFLDSLLVDSGVEFQFYEQDVQVINYLEDYNPDVIFLDMLILEQSVFQLIRKYKVVASLSPIFNHISEIDIFFHRSQILPPEFFKNSNRAKLCCGLEYTVIGERCRKIPMRIYEEVLFGGPLSVAISMGGTDAANKTLMILNTIKHISEPMIFWILLGEGYAHSYQALVDCMKGSQHEIILAKTNDSMWNVLRMCSIGVLAGGVTTYEAAYAGLPSLNLLENKKHSYLIQELEEKGIGVIVEDQFPRSLSKLKELLLSFANNRERLLEMHQNTINCIDDNGAQRIVSVAINYWRDSIRMR